MKLLRFENENGEIVYGTDYDGSSAFKIKGDPLGRFSKTDENMKVKKLLSPLEPENILCIGLNYKAHIEETNLPYPDFPVLFMKNTSAVTNPFDRIVIPESCKKEPEVDFEGELAVVMGKDAKNVKAENALNYVAGYTIGNDVSARVAQFNNGGQWIRGKSFDTFCPLGPFLVTDIDPDNLDLKTVLNGETMQHSNTSDMLFSVGQLIEVLSYGMTLSRGTVILTGTPSGVGFSRKPPVFLKDGDIIEITVEKIGTLSNRVKG